MDSSSALTIRDGVDVHAVRSVSSSPDRGPRLGRSPAKQAYRWTAFAGAEPARPPWDIRRSEPGGRRNRIVRVQARPSWQSSVSYTHLRAHETRHDLVCRLLLEK